VAVARYTPRMWTTLRRATLYFLVGFVIAFVIYLFIRFDANLVLVGIAIGAAAGVVVAAILLLLEHRFPEPPEPRD
jgi:hypothetical protein